MIKAQKFEGMMVFFCDECESLADELNDSPSYVIVDGQSSPVLCFRYICPTCSCLGNIPVLSC